MSYAEMVFATVPAAPPTEKNQRATSWPAPISANVPYVVPSRLRDNAFCRVVAAASAMVIVSFPGARSTSLHGMVAGRRVLPGEARGSTEDELAGRVLVYTSWVTIAPSPRFRPTRDDGRAR